MLKSLLIALVALLSVNAFAVETSQTTAPQGSEAFTVEAVLHTLSNSANPTFGPSLLYATTQDDQIGARISAPLGYSDHGNTSSFQALWRHSFSEGAPTGLFTEANLGLNVGTTAPIAGVSGSIGADLGILHRIDPSISVGGMAGLDFYPGALALLPQIALFGSVHL